MLMPKNDTKEIKKWVEEGVAKEEHKIQASHGKVLLLVEVEAYKNCRRLRQAHLDKDFPKKTSNAPSCAVGL